MSRAGELHREQTRICAILAGGRGSRIGGGKGMVRLAGRPLIEHAIATAAAAQLEPVIVAKPGTVLGPPDCRIVIEAAEPSHPLLGIATALAELDEALVVCPCDMPLLPAALLRTLATQTAPVTVVDGPRGIEPLLGRYEPSAEAGLRAAVESGSSARATLAELGAVTIDAGPVGTEPPEVYLFNVNTPGDRAGAERLLARR